MKVNNNQTLTLGIAICLIFTVLIFDSCMKESFELPCEKGVWYKGKLPISKDNSLPIYLSVKFSDDYVFVELMNDNIHEVYKMRKPKEKTEVLLFNSEKNKYNKAELVLKQGKENKDNIIVSFVDFDENIKIENQLLQTKKG